MLCIEKKITWEVEVRVMNEWEDVGKTSCSAI